MHMLMTWRWCGVVQSIRSASYAEFSAQLSKMEQQAVQAERKEMVLEAKVHAPLAESAASLLPRCDLPSVVSGLRLRASLRSLAVEVWC